MRGCYIRIFSALFYCLLLAGCGGKVEINADLDLSAADEGRRLRIVSNQGWTRYGGNPVMAGNSRDILAVSDPSVLHDPNAPGTRKYRMWFGSTGDSGDPPAISLAESEDGVFWTAPMRVFLPSESGWDNGWVFAPTVIRDDRDPDPRKRYKMWYAGSARLLPRFTRIGYATSPDGIRWTRLDAEKSPFGKEGLVMKASDRSPGDQMALSDPVVIRRGGLYHMWYAAGHADEIAISYATSKDGVAWEKHARNPVLRADGSGWEKKEVIAPEVLWDHSSHQYLMWYTAGRNGTEGIGFAVSRDGLIWQRTSAPVLTAQPFASGEGQGLASGAAVFQNGSMLNLWYAAKTRRGATVLNLATWAR